AFAQHPMHETQAAQSEPLRQGLGPVHHKVNTKKPLAQKYFDQGLALNYAFNHPAAERSFLRAAELDPQLAMAWWGVALALGPNINMPIDPDHERQAYEAIRKAVKLRSKASAEERMLVDALATRYSSSPKFDSGALSKTYAE